MTESKPWYLSLTLLGIVLALVGHLLQGGDLFGAETQEYVSQILTFFGLATAGVGRARASSTLTGPLPRRQGYSQVPLLWVVAALALAWAVLASGCARTYTVARSDVHLSPYGSAGISAKLTADEDPVCTVTGTRSSLTVDKGVAERVCKAWPTYCSWRAAP